MHVPIKTEMLLLELLQRQKETTHVTIFVCGQRVVSGIILRRSQSIPSQVTVSSSCVVMNELLVLKTIADPQYTVNQKSHEKGKLDETKGAT